MLQGRGCIIGSHCNIADDVRLGDNVIIGNNVTIYPKVDIQDHCRILDGTVIGRLTYPNSTVSRKAPESYQSLSIGQATIIGCNCVLYTAITIGNDVLLADGVSIRENCVLEEGTMLGRYVMVNYGTTIGKRSRIMDLTHITGNAKVGDDCFIGMLVGTANDKNVYLGRFGLGESGDDYLGPTIGHYAVVGVGATINPGVAVGDGAMIGTGSVVTRDIPAWTIALGQPAKPVKDVDPAWKEEILKLAAIRRQDLEP